MKLCQILAVEKSKKTTLHQELTSLHKIAQQSALMNGSHEKFTPKTDDGEEVPDKNVKVQHRYQDLVTQTSFRLTELMDVIATKDWGNCTAKADVKLGNRVILTQAPVPFLLFLEKELNDLHTFVKKMSELDSSEVWDLDNNSGLHRSQPEARSKTKKLQKPIVLYGATPEHPAQTQLITEDIVIGTTTKTKFSGAIPAPVKQDVLGRIEKLQDAVKFAREEANSSEVDKRVVGNTILRYIFEGPVESTTAEAPTT